MRVKIAMLVAGIVLGAAPATFAASGLWNTRGATYSCNGWRESAFCKETNWRQNYGVAIIPGAVDVTFAGHVIFSCDRAIKPAGNCTYFGR